MGLSDKLAVGRTLMASERTLMSWIRTSFSMIGFGFTIAKFLQASAAQGTIKLVRPHAPRNLGLALIGLGTVSVIIATIEYVKYKATLAPDGKVNFCDLTFIIASFVAVLGILVMANIVLGIGPF